VFGKAVVPSAIQFAAPTGKKLKEKDLEFCRKHTRFDDKAWDDFYANTAPNVVVADSIATESKLITTKEKVYSINLFAL
jgi:hypothetical protein